MYISMPRDFFVPVMYDYKENLNLIDEENQQMYRESKGNINAEYQKVLQEKEAIYVNPCSKNTSGEDKVNEEYYKGLQEKEATYTKPGSNNSSGKAKENEEYYKGVQEKEATYIKPGSNSSRGRKEAKEEYYKELQDKEATYVEPNMYKLIDDEYIKEATILENKPGNISCNKGETKENYNVSINRRMYSEFDEEYTRGFKR